MSEVGCLYGRLGGRLESMDSRGLEECVQLLESSRIDVSTRNLPYKRVSDTHVNITIKKFEI